ncbi:sugar phosphate isomerase/epimerase [Nonomuraea sp. NEAU-A123]|uniref:sugar phosphate isomerase/epimerase family protein n=1 Tax=Nonomuraea sp. NEAU-A123 TaxID=2839649 RepID=UPI001BE4316E|nr:sugar phosphate isomerase/epimerase [Nonomuraea sp. NEAU-A123]MBT2233649.1 sugar phosphate isomerase/epimerase [Nonomuraea sp. NEAU-A123]
MRLGVCSACLPELTPHQAAEAAAAAGYAGIEWRVSTEAGSQGPAHFLRNNRCTLRPLRQRTICPSAALAKQVVGHLPPHLVGVIYDPGNTVVEGSEDPRLALQILGEHLAHVHLKNAAYERAEGGGPWRPRWTTMDDGVLDVPAILRLLESAGYRGWVSVEDFSTDRPPREALAFNAAYLSDHTTFESAAGGRP